MTEQEYLAVLQNIDNAKNDVNSAYKQIGDLSTTLCDINQTMNYNPNVSIVKNKNGDVVGYDYKYISPNPPNITGMQMDSNIDSGLYGGGGSTRGGGAGRYRGSMYAGTVNTDELEPDKATGTGFVSGLISPAWAVVSGLGKLGKRVQNAAQDFIAETGDALADTFEGLMIPAVHDTANSIRALFGANPETGETTMYLDEDTIGAIGIVSRDNGVFEPSGYYITPPDELNITSIPIPFPYAYGSGLIIDVRSDVYNAVLSGACYFAISIYSPTLARITAASPNPNVVYTLDVQYGSQHRDITLNQTYTFDDKTVYFASGNWNLQFGPNYNSSPPIINPNSESISGGDYAKIAWALVYGTQSQSGGIEGITDETGGTVPVDAITGADPHVVASQLAQQYPTVMGTPIQVTVMDDSCNSKTINYYSVPISYSPTTVKINVPVSGTTQQIPSFSPYVELPDIDLQRMIEQIVLQLTGSGTGDDIVQTQVDDEGEEQILTIEPEPPSTGTGDTPIEELPIVDIRSMWHVYNPSSAELASLGNWLWSTNVIDVLIRTFSNPLESVMGVHAVYGEPSVSSAENIVVGPLTSSISSRVVNSQYTEVNCGSVWITEYFGNIFDYEPYTKISLFLPFIGIVNLSTSDVMRSEISIRYNIDVYTGSCVAFVSIIRDGAGGVLYQYTGNCAVEYPVSGASYSRLLQSIIGAVSNGITTAGTGGAGAGIISAGANFLSSNHEISVQRSGTFVSNTGAMGSKIPYIIITRPQTNLAINFEHFTGYPANTNIRLNECKGFTRCKKVHLNIPRAFNSEINEIEKMLIEGVIF